MQLRGLKGFDMEKTKGENGKVQMHTLPHGPFIIFPKMQTTF